MLALRGSGDTQEDVSEQLPPRDAKVPHGEKKAKKYKSNVRRHLVSQGYGHPLPCVAERVPSLLCALPCIAELLSLLTLHTGDGGSGAGSPMKSLKKEDYIFQIRLSFCAKKRQ